LMSSSNKKSSQLSLFWFINLKSWRTSSAWLHDLAVAGLAWWFAYLLRFNFVIPPNFVSSMWHTALWAIPLQSVSFIMFGLYRGIWRFASIPDLQRILKAILFAAVAIAAILFMFQPRGVVPRTVLVLDPILLILMMGGSRF